MRAQVAVGLDVHINSIAAHAVDTETGEIFTRTFGGSDLTGLIAWLRDLPGPCEAVYESGYCGFGLARFLIEHDVPCTVTQGRTLRGGRAKTDELDAEALSRLLIAGQLQQVYIPTEEQEAQREAARQRYALARQRESTKRRLSAFSHRHGLPKAIAIDSRALMLSTLNPGDRLSFEALAAQLENANHEIERLDRFMSREVERKPIMRALTHISGIGPVTAFTATAEAMSFSRFDSSRNYVSFLGLVPAPHNSGDKSVQFPNHKRTPSGACFYSAATTVLRSGVPFPVDGLADPENNVIRECLASLDSSQREHGNTHRAAIMARCIAEQAWALAHRLD